MGSAKGSDAGTGVEPSDPNAHPDPDAASQYDSTPSSSRQSPSSSSLPSPSYRPAPSPYVTLLKPSSSSSYPSHPTHPTHPAPVEYSPWGVLTRAERVRGKSPNRSALVLKAPGQGTLLESMNRTKVRLSSLLRCPVYC